MYVTRLAPLCSEAAVWWCPPVPSWGYAGLNRVAADQVTPSAYLPSKAIGQLRVTGQIDRTIAKNTKGRSN